MAHATSCKNLADFSEQELSTFLNSFDTVICDCDGVLWFLIQGPIPGSGEVINKFKEMGKNVHLVTNNCVTSFDMLYGFCQKLKINISKEDIITPAVSMVSYLKEKGLEKKKAYVVGSASLKSHLQTNGINLCEDNNDLWPEDLSGTIVKHLRNLDPTVGVVILDVDLNLNYMKCMTAIQYLKNSDCHFLAGASDDAIKVTQDIQFVGPGKFLSMVEEFSNKTPILMGKPGPYVAEVIRKKTSFIPERTLVIGDLISQDILFGKKCGFQTLFVLSGVNKLEDIKDTVPDYYVNSLGDLLPMMQHTASIKS